MIHRRAALSLGVLFGLLSMGCGRSGAPANHPRSALRAYVAAVEANRPKAAYGFLSAKVHKRLSFRAFSRRWRKNYREIRAQARAMRAALTKRKAYQVQARVRRGKRRVVLELEKGQWRIAGGVDSGFAPQTPQEAILALVRAVESRNFAAFLKLLSAPRRRALLRQIGLRIEKLKANLDREVQVNGDIARLQYDPKYWIQLVRENGAWRVDDFE